MPRSPRFPLYGLLCLAVAALACTPSGSLPVASAGSGAPGAALAGPIDPQIVRDQDDMTWADYKPIPGVDWTDTSKRGTVKEVRVAIVTADFPDQPFVLTLPKHSDMFGNPQIDPITRAQIPQFYAAFYNTPNAFNHGHTINEYWMEQSGGRIGVTVKAFGAYRMSHNVFQYSLPQTAMPGNVKAVTGTLTQELDSMWHADAGKDIRDQFDLVLRIYAGYDETATWQEFGEMKFQTKDDIPKAWGNPDTTKARWVRSRYGAWTPWVAAEWLWSSANLQNHSIQQGESINSVRHEISHAAFNIGDDYNNPFATPYRRAPTGPWDIMDRGSFNGPGGPHRRWVVPPDQGGSMAAGPMLRQRMLFKFLDTTTDVLILNRDGLAQSGLAVVDVTARETTRLPGTLSGVKIHLDGPAPHDRTPPDDPSTNPLSPGNPTYDFYTMEVVQRIGYDSYEPDHGVLIAKNKDRPSTTGGGNTYTNFAWVIDAHPEDITKADFKRPNGEVAMRPISDYRQLNDAPFHAGLNSGSQYEWEDTPNRLHFYVVDIHKSPSGVLYYTLAVRSLDGSGPQQRGVALAPPTGSGSVGSRGQLGFTLLNPGLPAATPTTAQPAQALPHLGSDVYRLSVSVVGQGWTTQLQNALAAVRSGGSQQVPVLVGRTGDAAPTAVVTLTATSESDPTKTTTSQFSVKK